MSKIKDQEKTVQAVTLVFSDGTKATFIGPAVISDQSEAKRIVEAYFSEPKLLPEGCAWESLNVS